MLLILPFIIYYFVFDIARLKYACIFVDEPSTLSLEEQRLKLSIARLDGKLRKCKSFETALNKQTRFILRIELTCF